ncbi:ERBB receptor feedback inhibitor 1 [Dendropsophus ebraccatus]|uniref:ERBB receptor feedback inhibitor 1 n=1 Tax=Dendropsophus ebraccatus TaxID=150705 RepID=UPI00383155F9
MTTAGLATQDVSLKTGFMHSAQGLMCGKSCWANHSEYENTFYGMDTMPYVIKAPAHQQTSSIGQHSRAATVNGHCCSENCMKKSNFLHLGMPIVEHSANCEDDQVVPSFKKLSMNGGSERTPPLTPVKSGPPQFYAIPPSDRSCRPLPPLPISEDHSLDEADSEVEFITSSETDLLIQDGRSLAFKYGVPSRRSFRGCGQINYAYFDSVSATKKSDEIPTCQQNGCVQNLKAQKPEQCHRRLRRSHSGPAGSYNKPAIRIHTNRTSPNSDEDKPEVPPRIPIPPRPIKPDYRRWSAEVSSNTYSDEDRPPKVPPREPLSRSNSRTPSPKSLPSYLNGVMPPTQSFAPDPKYVSSKALQRQNSEGSANKIPCILPIIENGKKASSTHYYLLPERPPYLYRYEKYFTESEEACSESWPSDSSLSCASAKPDAKPKLDNNHPKRKHIQDIVSL